MKEFATMQILFSVALILATLGEFSVCVKIIPLWLRRCISNTNKTLGPDQSAKPHCNRLTSFHQILHGATPIPRTLSDLIFWLRTCIILCNLKTSSRKPLAHFSPDFTGGLLSTVLRQFVKTVLRHSTRWLPCPYMVKHLKIFFSRTKRALRLNIGI